MDQKRFLSLILHTSDKTIIFQSRLEKVTLRLRLEKRIISYQISIGLKVVFIKISVKKLLDREKISHLVYPIFKGQGMKIKSRDLNNPLNLRTLL